MSEVLKNDPTALFEKGLLFAESGLLSDAVICFSRCIAFDPDNLSAYDAFATVLLNLGRNEKVIEVASKGLAIQNGAGADVSSLRTHLSIKLGRALARADRLDESETVLTKAVGYESSGEAHLELAATYLLANKLDEAIGQFTLTLGVLEDETLLYAAYRGLARAHHAKGDTASARTCFTHALTLAPASDIGIHLEVGDFYHEIGDLIQSCRHYKSATGIDPRSVEAWSGYGRVSALRGFLKQAHDAFLAALAVRETPELHEELAHLLLRMRQQERALKHFRRVLKLSPEDLKIAIEIASLYMGVGQLAAAKDVVEGGLRTHPDDPVLTAMLAEIHLLLNNEPMCRQYMRRVEELDPESFFAQELLGVLWCRMNEWEKALPHLYDAARLSMSSCLRSPIGAVLAVSPNPVFNADFYALACETFRAFERDNNEPKLRARVIAVLIALATAGSLSTVKQYAEWMMDEDNGVVVDADLKTDFMRACGTGKGKRSQRFKVEDNKLSPAYLPPRPVQYLRAYIKRYPQAWAAAASFRAEVENSGEDWPPHRFAPAPMFITHVTENPPQSGEVLHSFALSTHLEARILGSLTAWQATQGIFQFHNELFERLWNAPIDENLDAAIFRRLPQWCLYIETPDRDFRSMALYGFFVDLEREVYAEASGPEDSLRILLDTDVGLIPLTCELRGSVADAFRWMTDKDHLKLQRHVLAEQGLSAKQGKPMLDNMLKDLALELRPIFSMILYLCSERANFVGHDSVITPFTSLRPAFSPEPPADSINWLVW